MKALGATSTVDGQVHRLSMLDVLWILTRGVFRKVLLQEACDASMGGHE